MTSRNGIGSNGTATLEGPGVRVGVAATIQELEVRMQSRSVPPVQAASPEKIDEEIDAYIRALGREPNAEEASLVDQVKIKVGQTYEYQKHQLYALILLGNGGIVQGPQEDHAISEENICAEIGCLNRDDVDRGEMSKLVVAHKKHPDEGGEEHVVTPCEICRAEYVRQCPQIEVIIWYKRKLWVLPLRALLPLPYGQVTGLDHQIQIPADDPVASAIRKLFCAVGRKAGEAEQDLVQEAIIALERNFKHDERERFFSLAFTEHNMAVYGKRASVQKGPYPCAEVSVFCRNSGTGVGLRQLVCAYIGQDGKGHAGVPCEADRGRFLARHPDLEVIVEYEGEIWVLPLKVLLLLPYKQRRNGNGAKHHGDHTFTGEEHSKKF